MLFNSFPFVLVFLPVALLGYYAIAKVRLSLARLWVIVASFAFYVWWHPPFAVLLAISISFNYACGFAIRQLRGKPAQSYVLTAAISLNLLALFYYKYAYALTSWLTHLGIGHLTWANGVLLPLGISFFTFTQIGFLLDSKEAIHESSLTNYILFVTFFPHLIAGPILHHKEIMPQFADANNYSFHSERFSRGYALFIIGMLKKVLIADTLAPVANGGFLAPASLSFFPAWGALLCYSLQLYFDFSGYSDMAIGIARMFNIDFPLNFNSPYKATNIIDFWSRWHMSLTRYLNMYLFNPMAVRATRKIAARGLPIGRQDLAKPIPFLQTVGGPIFFTMVLAGVWHGAGLQFFIFGLLHATYLFVNHLWRVRTHGRPKPSAEAASSLGAGIIKIGCIALTYLAVLIGQIFFRAASTSDALALLSGMVGLRGAGAVVTLPAALYAHLGHLGASLHAKGLVLVAGPLDNGLDNLKIWVLMVLAYAIVWFMPNSQTIVGLFATKKSAKPSAPSSLLWPDLRLRLTTRWSLLFGVLTAVAILEIGAKSEFLYFQF